MLLTGHSDNIALAALPAGFGAFALSVGVFGWFHEKLSALPCLLLIVGGLCLIKPGRITDLIGAVLLLAGTAIVRGSIAKARSIRLSAQASGDP
ncbi:MAG: hypothetical protein HY712_07525 [candidate division NC10 bacterium]|nr:hypothetical protein [candidate division NC10 bacterium]